MQDMPVAFHSSFLKKMNESGIRGLSGMPKKILACIKLYHEKEK